MLLVLIELRTPVLPVKRLDGSSWYAHTISTGTVMAAPAVVTAPMVVTQPSSSSSSIDGKVIYKRFTSKDVLLPYDDYDNQIKYWVEYYELGVPWYWVKAQLIQESMLNNKAVSYMGAMGLGQFMPDTWKDMERKLWGGSKQDPFDPIYNIQATVYYDKWLMSQWKTPRPLADKWSLTLASYNAGLGNVLKAQKLANSILYAPTEQVLHLITGNSNSGQTKDYVDRIWKYSRRLKEQGDDTITIDGGG